MIKKIALLLVAWYLLFSGFYAAFFFGEDLPEFDNAFILLLAIPYLGFWALIWSLFFGVGEVVIAGGAYFSYLNFKSEKWLYFVCHSVIGLVGGFVFRVVSSY